MKYSQFDVDINKGDWIDLSIHTSLIEGISHITKVRRIEGNVTAVAVDGFLIERDGNRYNVLTDKVQSGQSVTVHGHRPVEKPRAVGYWEVSGAYDSATRKVERVMYWDGVTWRSVRGGFELYYLEDLIIVADNYIGDVE